MATVRCRQCSNLVAFRGRRATCPSCAAILKLPGPGEVLGIGENADPNIGPSEPTLVVEYGRTVNTTIAQSRSSGSAPLLIFGALALVVLGVGLSFLWWFISQPSSSPVATAPPAPTLPPAPVMPAPVPVAPAPKPPTAPAPTPAPAPVVRTWQPILPAQPKPDPAGLVTGPRVEQAIRKGVAHILSHFDGPFFSPKLGQPPSTVTGMDALCVYALLAAGRELQDPLLDARNPDMRAKLDRLKTAAIDPEFETYSRSLRLQCLAFLNRPEDRRIMEADLRYLLKSHVNGAFAYQAAKPGETRDSIAGRKWDASNSQYGLLGVWAASMAGMETPQTFWSDVQTFWLGVQDVQSGGWGYQGASGTTTMTCAGINALMVSVDQLMLGATPAKNQDYNTTRSAAARGLEFLSKENRLSNFSGSGYYGYAAYGIERVGLATGYKYIGETDWYRTIAGKMLTDQGPNGSFPGSEIQPSATAFSVLFLVRGRPPVMMSKLHYEANGPTAWQKYPRDLANLSVYASNRLERPLNWRVAELKRPWMDWMDSPVVMLSGSAPIEMGPEDIENLRQYTVHGGMILTHADGGSPEFTSWVGELASKIVPGGKLETLPPTHPIYSIVAKPDPAPPLSGLVNGNRLVLVHSPTDIASRWLRRLNASNQQNAEMGVNIFVYAAGKSLGKTRVESPVLPEPLDEPVGSFPLARLKYDGAWDPEPAAWSRALRDFELHTRIRVKPLEVSPAALPSPLELPVAVLTGTDEIKLTEADTRAIRTWVQNGGTLIVDPCGGNTKTADSINKLLPALLGSTPGQPLAATDPLLTGAGWADFGRDVSKVRLNDYTIGERGGRLPAPRIIRVGKGIVISSDLDMTTALLDTGIWGISGYTGEWTRGFVQNLLLTVANGKPGEAGPLNK